ncbi:MAG: redoxin family protein, partial [Polyangiales bacterium]
MRSCARVQRRSILPVPRCSPRSRPVRARMPHGSSPRRRSARTERGSLVRVRRLPISAGDSIRATPPPMISAGDKVPSVTIKQATPEGGADVDPSVLFAGKKVVMFSLPGAFTPTCSMKH